MEFETPLNDYILIKTNLTESLSEGGIIIPNTARSETGQGTVLAVSPDLKSPNVKKGDLIYYKKGKGESITKGEEFKLAIRYGDLMGKM